MDSALFRRWAAQQFETLRGLPVLYVLSQRGLNRTKVGLTTDWRKRIADYRTTLVEYDMHAVMIPRLERLKQLENEILKLMVKRIMHTRHPEDKTVAFSEWSAEPPEDVIARLQHLQTKVIAGWTFSSKAKRFRFHKQEAGEFPRTRFGREIKTPSSVERSAVTSASRRSMPMTVSPAASSIARVAAPIPDADPLIAMVRIS